MKVLRVILKITCFGYILLFVIQVAVALRRPANFRTRRFGAHTPRPRVIKGRDDVNNDYPYVVSLQREPPAAIYRVCTGSLIASQWVITAGHCCHNEPMVVRYGDMTIPRNESKLLSKVIEEFQHPSFSKFPYSHNDIGLIFVEAINLDSFGKLHAADFKSFVGRVAVFAGFGITFPITRENPKLEKMLAEDELKPLQLGKGLVNNEDYMKGFRNEDGYQMRYPKLIVVPKCDDRDHMAYAGDSGGPLIIDKRITGVVSGTVYRNAPHHTFYNFFTPVSPYIDWIRYTIAQQGT